MYYANFEYIIHEMSAAQGGLEADVKFDNGTGDGDVKTYPVEAWAVIQYCDQTQQVDSGTTRRPDLKRLNAEALVAMVRIGSEPTLAPLIDNPADGHFLKYFNVKGIRQGGT